VLPEVIWMSEASAEAYEPGEREVCISIRDPAAPLAARRIVVHCLAGVSRSPSLAAGVDGRLRSVGRARQDRQSRSVSAHRERLRAPARGAAPLVTLGISMFARRETLVQALNDLETGGLPTAETIIVGRRWWESLSTSEQTIFRTRAERAGVTLNVDDQLSAHYVEVRGGPSDQPLSGEHPI
jgi:hypothetical protein